MMKICFHSRLVSFPFISFVFNVFRLAPAHACYILVILECEEIRRDVKIHDSRYSPNWAQVPQLLG